MRILLCALFCVSLHAGDFTWKNPCTGGPDWIRDAFVIRVGDTYYMTGTSRDASGETEEAMWPGFCLWSSSDLQNWKTTALSSPTNK